MKNSGVADPGYTCLQCLACHKNWALSHKTVSRDRIKRRQDICNEQSTDQWLHVTHLTKRDWSYQGLDLCLSKRVWTVQPAASLRRNLPCSPADEWNASQGDGRKANDAQEEGGRNKETNLYVQPPASSNNYDYSIRVWKITNNIRFHSRFIKFNCFSFFIKILHLVKNSKVYKFQITV